MLLILCIGLTLSSPVLGQGAGASIEGTLRDQQGAVLPGATVTLRNEETGVSRTATTDTEGRYRFLALAPGRYHLTAELSGFATADVGNIAITIGRSVEQDFVMGIQAMEETVTVSGVAPAVDTTKSEVARAAVGLGLDDARDADLRARPDDEPRADERPREHERIPLEERPR